MENILLRKLSSSSDLLKLKLDLSNIKKRIHDPNHKELSITVIKRKMTFDWTPNERKDINKQLNQNRIKIFFKNLFFLFTSEDQTI